MTNFASQTAPRIMAAVAAIVLALSSIGAIVTVPPAQAANSVVELA